MQKLSFFCVINNIAIVTIQLLEFQHIVPKIFFHAKSNKVKPWCKLAHSNDENFLTSSVDTKLLK